MKRYAQIILIPLFIVSSVFAQAKAKLSSDDALIASCNMLSSGSEQAGAMSCIYYIQGYLAGTWTENNITMVESKEDTSEDFFERAARTRLGERGDRIKTIPVSYDCSVISEPKMRIIDVLATSLLPSVKSLDDINAKIHDAIKMVCPSNER